MTSTPRPLTRRAAAWFLRGLLITTPVAITIYISWLLIRWVDGLLGIPLPGLGLVVALLAITVIGALASTVVDQRLSATPKPARRPRSVSAPPKMGWA